MCDKSPPKIRQDYAEKFFVDSSCITKRSYLHLIRDYPYHEQITRLPLSPIIYQKVNSYYAFTEDIHPFTRIATVSEYLEMKKLPPYSPFFEESFIQNPYSEDEAINRYLRSYPPSFAIFGKPGLNTINVASAIASVWNCILISPISIIQQEINADTEKGRYIEEILRGGKCLRQEIIMDLIRCRVKMRDIKHKGYIIEGLPLIPNDLDYSQHISDIDNTCSECCKNTILETCGTYTDQIMSFEDQNLYQNLECKKQINYEREIPEQINEIFITWPQKPTLIIYMICPKEDVANICARRRMEAKTGNIIENMFTTELLDDKTKNNGSDNLFGFYQIPNKQSIISGNRKTHLLKRISDMSHNVRAQCNLYERLALPVIDEWILAQNPQYVIRVDGRSSTQRILELLSMRLYTLPLQWSILPKRMLDQNDVNQFSNINLNKELIEKSVEEIFVTLTQKEAVSPRFPWRLSAWKFYCPVELAQGRAIKGVSKYSVRFLNKIFFLSSKEAENLFSENPRTFLLPPNPRPTCKIAVFGPNYSGKSKLSMRLAESFRGTVININEIIKNVIKQRIDKKISDTICEMRKKAMQEMKDPLKTEKEIKEWTRLTNFLSWFAESVEVFDHLINILEINKFDNDNGEYDKELENIRLKLQSLGLAYLEDDQQLMKQIKVDRSLLYDYILQNFIPNSENDDNKEILQDRIKRIYDEYADISTNEKAEIIIQNIKKIPDEKLEDTLLRDGGYIIDGMYMDIDIWRKVVDDANIVLEDLILLFENEPHIYLLDKFRNFSQLDGSLYKTDYIHNGIYMESDYGELGTSYENEEEKYLEHLKAFKSIWANFEEQLSKFEGNLIKCNIASIEDVADYVINHIKNRFRATVTTRIKVHDEENETVKENTTNFTDENVEEKEEEEKILTNTQKHFTLDDGRLLGDSSYYCPVALSLHNICWKGKDKYTAYFMDKIYMLSSDSALNEFLKDPTKFSIPFLKPRFSIPPLRISIVGPPGSGKTKMSKILSKEYGMVHIDYFDNFTMFIKKRAMNLFTPKDLVISVDNYDEQIELPIDLHDERYNSYEPTVRNFVRQYWKIGGELPSRMLQECLLAFYEPPYNQCGIILDGFPSCPEDAEAAIANYAVPELIIELRCSLQTSLNRMLPILFAACKENLDERKRIEKERYKKDHEKWIERCLKRQKQHQTEDHIKMYENAEFEDSSMLWTGYNNKETETTLDTDKVEFEEFLHEFPEWEDFEIAKERIIQEIVTLYENYAQKLLATRNVLKNESIPWIEIDAEDNERTVFLRLLNLLDAFVFRNISMFEQTYTVDLETAERLLDCGYYFLSSFGRWCPVQIYTNEIPIQMFLPMKTHGEIFPVIHRQYIYFLAGNEAHSAFLNNPLKYLAQDSRLVLLPLRISIIGPPKCGKTTLANRFAKRYSLEVITPGKALRHMLKNYNWTEAARMAEDQLRTGQAISIDSQLIIRAIEMFSIGPRATSQGYVLDGCQINRKGSEQLALLGIQPMIVLDLKADLQFCVKCLSWDHNETKRPPNFSPNFLSHRYATWQAYKANFRDWLKKFSRNVIELDATKNKWNVWTCADYVVRSRITDIILYFREADFDKVHSLKYMCVSPFEFRKRQSQFKSYCPVCLSAERISKNSDQPTDSQEMVQFREYFYWICSQHVHTFVKNPLQYISAINSTLYDEQPRILQKTVDIECPCVAQRLRANGLCLVTYVDNLPNRILIKGKSDLVVFYKNCIYLFCSEECREKFLINHNKYSKIDIKYPHELSPIEIQFLPTLGFLEQTVAKIIIEAVNHSTVHRPKIVGLSAAVSAAIYIGIYLKIHNISKDLKEIDFYKTASKRIMEQNRIIKIVTDTMKKKLNPYLSLPKYKTKK